MGSGKKFTVFSTGSFGVGVSISRFPFSVTFNAQLLFWGVSLGFGKGYDE